MSFIEEKHRGRTCKILTLNTLSGKLCIKEALKIVDGVNEDIANAVSNSIPKKFGKVLDFEDAIKESPAFAQYIKQYHRSYKVALKLEGLIKNTGVHPSGIAICHDNLDDTMPYGKTKDGDLVSGFEMNDVASVAIKFDILGLRTLTVLDQVCKMTGLVLEEVDKDDKETYQFLQNLIAPQGLFQIETDVGFRVCQKVRPKNLHDLSAVLAIARPGALAFADQYAKFSNTGEVESIHPFFDDILGWTGSIPLYQEQLIAMARKIGFTSDEGEQLRRIVGKKKVDQMKEWKEKIHDKIKENNLDPKIGEILWKVAEDSANYSFNACLSPETIVEKDSGFECLSNIKKGDKVLAYDTENKKDHFVEVVDIHPNFVELFKIEFEDGRVIECSMDHKFLCEDGKMRAMKNILRGGHDILCKD